MKKILFLLTFISALCCSCSNDSTVTGNNQTLEEFVLIPNTPSKSKLMSRSVGDLDGATFYKVMDGVDKLPEEYQGNVPPAITQNEVFTVLEYLKNHPNEGSTECSLANYFLQNIGSNMDSYTTVDWNHAQHNVIGGSVMDYLYINGEHIQDYNAVSGPDILCVNLPLNNPSYHDSYGNNTYYTYRFYSINGNLYLCFDYQTEKTSSGEKLEGDGVYNDWVIKITDANSSIVPDVPTVITEGEVEINLSINETREKDDYLSSKTSIHVRDTTDFEVFLPIPPAYYCPVDDMLIVHKHDVDYVYSTYNEFVTKVIDGETVTLTISYKTNGIYISSTGINAKVLQYCRKYYYDGLTFEVWNYYTNTINRIGLKEKLNQSTVTFTHRPQNYKNTIVNNLDCIVTQK